MTTRSEIQKLVDANLDISDKLDNYVQDVAASAATNTNNDGVKSQLEFLNANGHNDEMVLRYLKGE